MLNRPHSASRSLVAALFALSALPLILTGCAVSRTMPASSNAHAIHLQGHAFGGQQPVTGSTIQLWAAGSNGSASLATALLSSPVMTDSNGSFSITGDYTCPSSSTPVYLTATHGNPGLNNPSADNAALALVTVLGPCGSLSSATSVTVNEVTTVAASIALAPFASSVATVGSSSTNSAGLTSAMNNAMALADSATGVSPAAALPSNATVESAKIYTLANLLAACVNSDGTGLCSTLFQDAVGTSASATPSDTFQLALQIAQHPGNNVQSLFNDIPAQTAFGGGLPQAPSDWTVSIAYTGGGLYEPAGLSIAGDGSIWVANIGNALSQFSPQGVSLQGSGITGFGLYNSVAVSVDSTNDIWVANMQSPGNNGNGAVARFSSSGFSLSGSNGISGGNINYPVAFAADANGSTWVANYGSSVLTEFDPSGALLSGANGVGGGILSAPTALAVDSAHNVWVASRSNGVIAQFDSTGTPLYQTPLPNGALPDSLTIDSAGKIWIADNANSLVNVISPGAGVVLSGSSPFLDRPRSLTVDAGDRLYATNNVRNTIAVFSATNGPANFGDPLSPQIGFGLDAGMHQPFAAAADSAGTLWVTSLGDNRLIAFPGLATPTKTPTIGQAVAP